MKSLRIQERVIGIGGVLYYELSRSIGSWTVRKVFEKNQPDEKIKELRKKLI
jgi:hypothetical protein